MGMDRVVKFAETAAVDWPGVRDRLTAGGFPTQLVMIDGQLAFPDEEPTPDWTELRVKTPQGMVTLRREPGRVSCVTWGNADAALREAWNAVAWAVAAAGGRVETDAGELDADAFRGQVEMPAVLRSPRTDAV
jgi:hypothetical protein